MPTTRSTASPSSSRARSAAIASSASVSVASVDEPVEAEPLHVAHRADVDAEPLLDVRPAADRELGAAATGVEDDDRGVSDIQLRCRREVGQAGFLVPGDHLDVDAVDVPDRVDELGAVGREPQSGGTDRDDRLDVVARRFLGHAGDRLRRAVDRVDAQPARGSPGPGRAE
jgi:hypothetical protein